MHYVNLLNLLYERLKLKNKIRATEANKLRQQSWIDVRFYGKVCIFQNSSLILKLKVVYAQKPFPSVNTRGQSNTAVNGPRSGVLAKVRFASFPQPQSRLEKISSCLASNHPYHTGKPQQYTEFNDRSNCFGSPTFRHSRLMNDSPNVQLCEQITAAWMLSKPIRYGHNFSFVAPLQRRVDFQRLENGKVRKRFGFF